MNKKLLLVGMIILLLYGTLCGCIEEKNIEGDDTYSENDTETNDENDTQSKDEENIGQSGYCTRLNNNQEWKAQSFIPDADEITKLGVQLKRTSGATTGNYYIALHSDSSGEPGSAMKQQTFLLSDVSTSMTWYYYDFSSSPVSVTPGNTYYVMVRLVTNQPAYEYLDWHMSPGNYYDKGVRWWSSNGGSSWHSSPEDAGFRVYGYGMDKNE